MALNYSELDRIKDEISTDLDELTSLFNSFTALIDDNVNNQSVWYGTSSQQFKKNWDNFAEERFPEYKSFFNKEINNVMAAINSWGNAEGN